MLKSLRRFLFDYKYFSRTQYDKETELLAMEAGSRPCRGNVSAQAKRFVTERQLIEEAKRPVC